jgi:hypothetical protein
MSKHSLNTKSVFLNAKSPAGNVGFAADRIDVLDLFMRETSRGMSRVRRSGQEQVWGYPQPDLDRHPPMGTRRPQPGALLPVLWARLVLCGSSAS